MTPAWQILWLLCGICLLLLSGWLVWLVRRAREWPAQLTLRFLRLFGVMACLGFTLNVIANPAVWQGLLAGDLSEPKVLVLLLSWGWAGPFYCVGSSLLIYRAARRAETTGSHRSLLREIVIDTCACWSGWIICLPVLIGLGHWTGPECVTLVAGGLVAASMFALSAYVQFEPEIISKFRCLTREVSIRRRFSVSLWTLFLNIMLSVTVILIANRGQGMLSTLGVVGTGFALFTLPCAHLIRQTTRSLTSPLIEMARQMGASEKPELIQIASRDEVAVVVNSYNALARGLHQAYAVLEEKVAARTAELEQANEELRAAKEAADAASRFKSEFLANMSHEIRTPMTAVLGFADVLLEKDNISQASPEQVEAAATIKRNGEHLLGIINDILDLSKIEAGRMAVEPTPCSPCQIVAEVASIARVRAEAQGITFCTEYVGSVPERITTDPIRLRQILINIVANAIKFTKQGEVRLIARFVDDGEAARMQFDVVDTGIGMSADSVAGLFQPFVQGDSSTTRKFGGTGLGLTISKQFAEMLGGDVCLVETRPGVGTRFRITVVTGPLDGIRMIEDPASATVVAREAARAGTVSGPQHLLGCRVLLAEDGPDNQRLITHLLRKEGAEVVVVENGKLAVDTIRNPSDGAKPFDVVLMDMQMPIMDGYEAAAVLRKGGYDGTIIALTAHAMGVDREKCVKAGCNGYAAKPINRKKLINTIRKHLPAGLIS